MLSLFGSRIDVLVDSGSIARAYWTEGKPIEDEVAVEEWNTYLKTSMTDPFLVSQAYSSFMKVDHETAKDDVGRCIIHIAHFVPTSCPSMKPELWRTRLDGGWNRWLGPRYGSERTTLEHSCERDITKRDESELRV